MPTAPADNSLSAEQLRDITAHTLQHYDAHAHDFCAATAQHNVTQNITALLAEIQSPPPYRILDFGCGPGRDLLQFAALGHEPVGLDGCAAFVEMARQNCGCEVLQQNFLTLRLPRAHFHGVFANASLFHVPQQQLPQVLGALQQTLVADGVLFASNPRGDNQQGWHGERYGCFYALPRWRAYVTAAGFTELRHYYRPTGKPRAQQPWLATLWRKSRE